MNVFDNVVLVDTVYDGVANASNHIGLNENGDTGQYVDMPVEHVLGSELLCNVDFIDDTCITNAGTPIITYADNTMTVESNGNDYAYAEQNITCEIGKTYTVTCQVENINCAGISGALLHIRDSANGLFELSNPDEGTTKTLTGTFVATEVDLQCRFTPHSSTDGQQAKFSQPTIKEVTNPNSYITYFDVATKAHATEVAVGTTKQYTTSFSNCFTTDVEVIPNDLLLLDAKPHLIGVLYLTGTQNGLSFTQANIKSYSPCNEGSKGDGTIYNILIPLGGDIITNGTFDTDSDWTKQTGWTISGSEAHCDGTQTGNTNMRQITLEDGKTYVCSYDVIAISAGTVRFILGGANNDITHDSIGHYRETFTAGGTILDIRGNVDFVGTVDNVVVEEAIGYTEIQGYTDNCRTFLENTNYGLSNILFVQDVSSGEMLSFTSANTMQVDNGGKHIDTGWKPNLEKYTIQQVVSGELQDLGNDLLEQVAPTILNNNEITTFSSNADNSFNLAITTVGTNSRRPRISSNIIETTDLNKQYILTLDVTINSGNCSLSRYCINGIGVPDFRRELISGINTFLYDTPNDGDILNLDFEGDKLFNITVHSWTYKELITKTQRTEARLLTHEKDVADKLYIDTVLQTETPSLPDPDTIIKLNNTAVIGYPDEITEVSSRFKVITEVEAP